MPTVQQLKDKGKFRRAAKLFELESAERARRQQLEAQDLQRASFETIRPLAESLISLGISPADFASSPLGQAILSQMQGGIRSNFQQARTNLAESLGGRGLTGSGVGIGPLANLFGAEASQQAQAVQQLPLTGLNFALQGANLLQGQQALPAFNPVALGGLANQAAGTLVNAPPGPGVQIAQALAGGGGSALSGLFGGQGGGGGGNLGGQIDPLGGA